MGSERKMRKAAVEMVGTNLLSEAAPFSFCLKSGGEEIRAAPLVYIPDLCAKVLELLEQNERYVRGRGHQGTSSGGGHHAFPWRREGFLWPSGEGYQLFS